MFISLGGLPPYIHCWGIFTLQVRCYVRQVEKEENSWEQGQCFVLGEGEIFSAGGKRSPELMGDSNPETQGHWRGPAFTRV